MQKIFKDIIKALHDAGGCDADNDYDKGWDNAISTAISEVETVIAKYNNGWIPVGERLPEEHDAFSDEFDPLTMAVIDTKWYTESDLVAVTVYDSEHDKYFVCDDCTINGKWCNHADGFKTVAWQPLPEPYKKDR